MCFGMETLMELDITGVRKFFKAFFVLPDELWGGFLSWRMNALTLSQMAWLLFVSMPLPMRVNFFFSALPFMPSFLVNLLLPTNNKFESGRWAGLPKPKALLPKPAQGASGEPGGAGDAPIALPVKGFERAEVAEAKRALASVAGMCLDKAEPASALRDDRDWTRFQQHKTFPDQVRCPRAPSAHPSGDKCQTCVGMFAESHLLVKHFGQFVCAGR